MEAIIVGALIIGAVLWFSSSRKQQAVVARREELQEYVYVDDREPPFLTTWTVHFPVMRMVVEFEALDHPEDEHTPTEYMLDRTDRGWRMKVSGRSQRLSIEEQRAIIARGGFGKPFAETRLRELEKGNEWHPVPTDELPGLEVAYQRYIRQG